MSPLGRLCCKGDEEHDTPEVLGEQSQEDGIESKEEKSIPSAPCCHDSGSAAINIDEAYKQDGKATQKEDVREQSRVGRDRKRVWCATRQQRLGGERNGP